MQKTPSSDITPEGLYYSRRKLIKKTDLFAGILSALTACNKIFKPLLRWSNSNEGRTGRKVSRSKFLFNGYKEEAAYLFNNLEMSVNY
jgi:hypothetical protein